MPKPVGRSDYYFIAICFTLGMMSYLVLRYVFTYEVFMAHMNLATIFWAVLLLSIGCGGLRLMQMIRDY